MYTMTVKIAGRGANPASGGQSNVGDGVSQAGELFTLADKGIASISLIATSTSINLGNGNVVSGTSTVTRSNGSTTLAETVSVAVPTPPRPTSTSRATRFTASSPTRWNSPPRRRRCPRWAARAGCVICARQ